MDDILNQITKLPEMEAELADLEERLPKLRDQVNMLRRFRGVVEIAIKNSVRMGEAANYKAFPYKARRTYPQTVRDMTLAVLTKRDEPRTIPDLEAAIQEKFNVEVHRGSLDTTLQALKRAGLVTHEKGVGWYFSA